MFAGPTGQIGNVDSVGAEMSRIFSGVAISFLVVGAIIEFANLSPATAENWVDVVPNDGLDSCLDKDSVQTGADGLTYFTSKFCADDDKHNMVEAVQCSQDWSGANISIRSRSMRPKRDGSWLWIDEETGTTTILGATAKAACGK